MSGQFHVARRYPLDGRMSRPQSGTGRSKVEKMSGSCRESNPGCPARRYTSSLLLIFMGLTVSPALTGVNSRRWTPNPKFTTRPWFCQPRCFPKMQSRSYRADVFKTRRNLKENGNFMGQASPNVLVQLPFSTVIKCTEPRDGNSSSPTEPKGSVPRS
jgi:hypothetical protein